MSRQRARHRRKKLAAIRLGAVVVVPAVVAAGAYAVMSSGTNPDSASADSTSIYTFVPRDPETPTSSPATTPPTSTPSSAALATPTDTPSSPAAEPTDDSDDNGSTDTSAPKTASGTSETSSPDSDPTPLGTSTTHSPDPTPTAEPSQSDVTPTGLEATALNLIDDLRPGKCPDLTVDSRLMASARAHSIDMRDRRFFSTENPDGEQPVDRAQEQRYAGDVDEAIARAVVVDALDLTLPGLDKSDREAIADCSNVAVGVGIATKGLTGYWTIDLGDR